MPAINLRATKGGRNMAPVTKKQKLHSVGRLLKYVFKYYPWQFFLVLVCIVLSAGVGVVGSYFLGTVIIDDYVQVALKNSIFLDQVVPSSGILAGVHFSSAILIMAAIYLSGLIASYVYNVLMAIIGQGVQKRIRDDLFDHLETLPISYFDRRGHGDIMSIFTNDVDALREMLSRALPMVAQSIMTIVVCLVMMLLTDLLLTGVVLGFAVLIFFFTRFAAKRSSKYFIEQQIELGKTNGYIEEMISGQRVVKVFNYEERNIKGFQAHNDAFFGESVKANRYASILMPTVNQLGNIQYALLALLGGLAIVNNATGYSLLGVHAFEVGIIVSFLLYSKSFTQPIGQVSQQLNVMALALAGATRIFEVIDAPSEVDDGYVELVNAKADSNGDPVEVQEHTGKWAWKHPHKDGTPTTYVWVKGKITFDHVDFAYIPGKTVLHDITLYAKPGQKVAFVGPTGAGKTTITNLINRFYDIEDGKIRYDDININKIKKNDLRRSLGVVLQDVKLFTGTVKDNIRVGKRDATDEEIIAAAKLANADSFIRNLPQGYDTVLESGGASLSQGQRQLLSIARCAVMDPPVMILDEATSSIDSRTEKLVQQGMDQIMKGRTVFVIAHRLSTIQNSDVIMVLEHGSIIERGTHQQLLDLHGKYNQLYTGGKVTSEE
ncbi:MAG: putative ABC transporter ATP-binding protein [Tenericutes bacterium ADurb.BinA155]|jgi:ATP-binding cassette subfamily B multidrug efflux pump|nr:MAG: putative ABC transporter ATP-binding protein [Tenericutes bacterium ADurb.BinA155]